jgi:hypothetical protein
LCQVFGWCQIASPKYRLTSSDCIEAWVDIDIRLYWLLLRHLEEIVTTSLRHLKIEAGRSAQKRTITTASKD